MDSHTTVNHILSAKSCGPYLVNVLAHQRSRDISIVASKLTKQLLWLTAAADG